MGQDKLFCGFLRLLIARMRAVLAEKDQQKRTELLEEIIKDLQSTLED